MIEIDSRVGSKELFPKLQSRGIPCKLTTLEFGDVCFNWKGPKGRSISVGIERKTLGDLLTCIRDGRYIAHQLPGMKNTYELVYLLIEGRYRYNWGGWIEVPRGKGWGPPHGTSSPPMASMLEHFLTSREVQNGVRVIYADTLDESACLIHHKYTYGLVDWESHNSSHAFDESSDLVVGFRATPPDIAYQVASRLDGIGVKKVGAVTRALPSVEQMVMAKVDEWANIEYKDKHGKPRKLGAATAEKIVKAKGWLRYL